MSRFAIQTISKWPIRKFYFSINRRATWWDWLPHILQFFELPNFQLYKWPKLQLYIQGFLYSFMLWSKCSIFKKVSKALHFLLLLSKIFKASKKWFMFQYFPSPTIILVCFTLVERVVLRPQKCKERFLSLTKKLKIWFYIIFRKTLRC